MFAPIAAAVIVGFIGWAYKEILPPAPKLCGTPGGPPITSPRVKLSDGGHLSYREAGVPKEEAKYKIIIIHGYDSCKDVYLPASREFIVGLKIYFLLFDQAGYGESDPNPNRSIKSEAYDIQELADKLQIGSKFHILGMSMGATFVYGCLRYIPHSISGLFEWHIMPLGCSLGGFTQKLFPSLSLLQGGLPMFSNRDMELLGQLSKELAFEKEKVRQQSIYESLGRDLMIARGDWGFDILDLKNPFPNNEGSVHIWQGAEDKLICSSINRFLAEKLPWIQYHEVPEAGHLIFYDKDILEDIFSSLFLGSSVPPTASTSPL